MDKLKFFALGFMSCLVPALALSYVVFMNVSHTLLVSKINTDVSFVEMAAAPDGIEKLRSVISVTLSNDYCSAKQLGDNVVIRHSTHDSKVYEKVEKYLEKYELKRTCSE